MPFQLEACLFDLDGVIVDTAKYHFTAWQRLAEELGVAFDHADNDQLKGVSRVDSLEYILRKGNLDLDNDTKVRLMERKNTWYLEQVDGMTPGEMFPGIVAFLDELRAAGVGVALGSSSRNAPLILERCGIADRFDAVVDGNSITFSKPDPEVFLKGADALKVKPANTVVFEDALSGVEAALNGGFRVVGLGAEGALPKSDFMLQGFEGFTMTQLVERLS
ncbi:MAG: beta-phosphoglucomutase [Flavobacteriales bacterium]|nr:beta-phosphoglucomutase [Flavobacteriales bacterium]